MSRKRKTERERERTKEVIRYTEEIFPPRKKGF